MKTQRISTAIRSSFFPCSVMFQGQIACVGRTRAQAGQGGELRLYFYKHMELWARPACSSGSLPLPAPSGAESGERRTRLTRPAFITHRPKGASFRWRLPKVYTTPPRGLDNMLGTYFLWILPMDLHIILKSMRWNYITPSQGINFGCSIRDYTNSMGANSCSLCLSELVIVYLRHAKHFNSFEHFVWVSLKSATS